MVLGDVLSHYMGSNHRCWVIPHHTITQSPITEMKSHLPHCEWAVYLLKNLLQFLPVNIPGYKTCKGSQWCGSWVITMTILTCVQFSFSEIFRPTTKNKVHPYFKTKMNNNHSIIFISQLLLKVENLLLLLAP